MIGQTLKNYVIEEMLGKGGMGVVYRARDLKLDRSVALKVIPPELCTDPDRKRRFIQEARAASAINHPAIAAIYEIDDSTETAFIVMEYVDGSTLRGLVARRELDLPSAVEIAIMVADGLARAHEAGIVHRDVKSDNIMVTKDGHAKILDFGLAKLLGPPGDSAGGAGLSRLATLTQTGVIVGTVAYMSPEQARGLPTDKRSDIFSFGVVLYEMVAAKLPFEGASPLDTMHAVAFDSVAPVTTLRSGVPYSLQRVIERCLEKKPEDRYPDLRETVADLRTVKREIESGVSGGMPVLDRVRGWYRGFTARGLAWAIVLGALLGGAAIFLAAGRGVDVPAVIGLLVLGFFLYRRFRNRGQKARKRFVKKASALQEVHLVAFVRGEFTIVTEGATARTYVKLNAFLSAANERLLRGEPMTMVIREKVDEEERVRILSSPGVQFVRDAPRRVTSAAS